MNPTPAFLRALDLGPDADERAVRRAYAQRLKRIDPATDPDDFQALRGHYEAALHWVQRPREAADGEEVAAAAAEVAHLAEAAAAAEPDPPLTPAEPAMDPAHQAGEAVFAELAQSVPQFGDEAQATRALDHALNDERLLNLEARTFFEWRVAGLLVDGWQRGHEFLLGPAGKRFGWEEDRRRLQLFGQLGGALDAAITEKLIFYRQNPGDFEQQRDVVRRLRDPAEPSPDTLRSQMPLLHLLVQRYPHWLRMVTSRDNISRWYTLHDALPVQPQPEAAPATVPAADAPGSSGRRTWGLSWWPVGIVVVVLLRVLGSFGGSGTQPYAHDPSMYELRSGNRPSLAVPTPQVQPILPAPADAASATKKKGRPA